MTKFICPICRTPLAGDKTLKCLNGHCFDRARAGYINLLSGKGGNHGDPKEMILARKSFLDKGYYAPLADAIAEEVARLCKDGMTLLDAGCGECYYTKKAADITAAQNKNIHYMGIDVSKDAVNYGGKRFPGCDLSVASVYAMPITDKSVDILLSVFAPAAIEEFRRVSAENGYLIMVIGGKDHLWELKSAVYDEPYKNSPADYALEGFEFISKKELNYTIDLASNEDIKSLFAMTPYYHKTSQKDMAKLDTLETLTTKVDFEILIYRLR